MVLRISGMRVSKVVGGFVAGVSGAGGGVLHRVSNSSFIHTMPGFQLSRTYFTSIVATTVLSCLVCWCELNGDAGRGTRSKAAAFEGRSG